MNRYRVSRIMNAGKLVVVKEILADHYKLVSSYATFEYSAARYDFATVEKRLFRANQIRIVATITMVGQHLIEEVA